MNYHIIDNITSIPVDEPMFVHFQNEGQIIKSTNWWDLQLSKQFCFVSFFSGCVRLLLPPTAIPALPDMHIGVKQIVVSICLCARTNGFVAEILFDDASDEPFVIHVCENQIDFMPNKRSAARRFRFDVYIDSDGPKRVLTSEAMVRFVPRIPWLKPFKSNEVSKIELL